MAGLKKLLPEPLRGKDRVGGLLLVAFLLAALCGGIAQSTDGSAPTVKAHSKAAAHKPKAGNTHKPEAERRHKAVKAAVKVVEPEKPPTAPAPEPQKEEERPKWPINDQPLKADVTWDSHGLTVQADNSSLSQILNEISTLTGTTVAGFGRDHEQRVYGSYGPGRARDVLVQLLQGTGYNVVMVGDLGQGAPRQLLLSLPGTQPGAENSAKPSPARAANPDDEDEDAPEELPSPPQRTPRPGGLPGRGDVNPPGGPPN